MTRQVYPADGAQLLYQPGGLGQALTSNAGRTVPIYADAALSALADVQDMSGATLPDSLLTIDADSLLPDFLGPDGADVLYVRGSNGSAYPVRPRGYRSSTADTKAADPADTYGIVRLGRILLYAHDGTPGNRLPYADSCFEQFQAARAGTVGQWLPLSSSCTLAPVVENAATNPSESQHSLEITSVAGGTVTLISGPISTVPGAVEKIAAQWKAGTSGRSCKVSARWRADTSTISTVDGTTVTDAAGSWSAQSQLSAVAPATADNYQIIVTITGTATNERHRLSGVVGKTGTASDITYVPPMVARPGAGTWSGMDAGDRYIQLDSDKTWRCAVSGRPDQQGWSVVGQAPPDAPTTGQNPGAPTNVTVRAGVGRAAVSFTPPASDGGSPITSYTVTASTGQTATGTGTQIVVNGLTNGVVVSFTVTATNVIGTSAASSSSAAVTPADRAAVTVAPARVQQVGTGSSSTAGTTVVNVTTTAVTRGNSILVAIAANGGRTDVTVTDSSGNVYTLDGSASTGVATTVYLFSAHHVTPLTATDVIRVTFATAVQYVSVQADEVSGLTGGTDDDPSQGAGSSTTAFTAGTVVTSVGNAYVLGAFGFASNNTSQTITAGSGFTSNATTRGGTGSTSRDLYTERKIQTTAGSVTVAASQGSAKTYAGIAQAYTAAFAGASVGLPAYVRSLGVGTFGNSSGTTSAGTITTTAAAAAGNSIVVDVVANGGQQTLTVTDSAGNTYSLDAVEATGTATTVYKFSAHNITALGSGGTVTLTWGSARTNVVSQAHEITGIKAATDAATVGTAASTAMSTTAYTTASADDFVMTCFGFASNNADLAITVGGGETAAPVAYARAQGTTGSASRDMWCSYREVPTPGSSGHATATLGASKTWVGCTVAYLSSGSGSGGGSQTGTYTSLSGLQVALLNALPGDVLTLAAATTFAGRLNITDVHGLAGSPITVIGGHPTTSLLDGGSNATGYGVAVDLCSYLVLKQFKVINSQKGVMVDRSSFVTIDGLTVDHIGNEGIHLRNETNDSTVKNCTISNTGETDSRFGESLYCGTAVSNWTAAQRKPAAASGFPDRCRRNTFIANTCSLSTGEMIDIKEGTDSGVVAGNSWDGATIAGSNSADSWVDVKGSGWTIGGPAPADGNTGTKIMQAGYQTHTISIPSQWLSPYVDWNGVTQPAVILASNNVFQNNVSHGAGATVNGGGSNAAPGYCFEVTDGTGNVVYDSNTQDGFTSGLSNIPTTGAGSNLTFGFTVTSADPWAPGGSMSGTMATNLALAVKVGNMHAYTFGGSIGDHLDTGIATDGAHPTNVYKWARDYTFVDNSIAHFGTAGLGKYVVLSMCPTTISGEPDYAYSFAAPQPGNRAALAAWAVEVCAHYLALGVTHFHFYNELKGYSSFATYLADYNAIWDAVKASGAAAAKIGGPYQIIRQRQSGWSPSDVEGAFGAVYQGLIDDYVNFIANAHGYDFLAVDLSAGDQTGDTTGDYNPQGKSFTDFVSYFPAVAGWLDGLLPAGKPVVCSEFYGFSGTSGDQFELASTGWASALNGRPTTILLWNESDAIAGRVVITGTGALGVIGARMADMRSRGAAL